jgi:regulator of RNase E activity RraB
MTQPDYPQDDDGDALRRVAACGNDMSKSMDIDFQIAVENEAAAKKVAEAASAIGYRVGISFDEEDEAWTVDCTKLMLATYDSVMSAQKELDALAEPMGGFCDGWGTFGNV